MQALSQPGFYALLGALIAPLVVLVAAIFGLYLQYGCGIETWWREWRSERRIARRLSPEARAYLRAELRRRNW